MSIKKKVGPSERKKWTSTEKERAGEFMTNWEMAQVDIDQAEDDERKAEQGLRKLGINPENPPAWLMG